MTVAKPAGTVASLVPRTAVIKQHASTNDLPAMLPFELSAVASDRQACLVCDSGTYWLMKCRNSRDAVIRTGDVSRDCVAPICQSDVQPR